MHGTTAVGEGSHARGSNLSGTETRYVEAEIPSPKKKEPQILKRNVYRELWSMSTVAQLVVFTNGRGGSANL